MSPFLPVHPATYEYYKILNTTVALCQGQMRLLKIDSDGGISLTEDNHNHVARYAILSHTWGAHDTEVTFDDLIRGKSKEKAGFTKILFCAEQAKKDGLQYLWVDTCCIDKANHTELTTAITSMFRWYRDAAKCYVYLSDVSVDDQGANIHQRTWESAFRNSRWFKRGWTLQELLAPQSVEFFSLEGTHLGDKRQLEHQIHDVTRIPIQALRGSPLSHFSVEERMQWAAGRETSRKEDKAYCLQGIFGVFIPLIYGEEDNAFSRLKEAINKSLEGEFSMLWLACL